MNNRCIKFVNAIAKITLIIAVAVLCIRFIVPKVIYPKKYSHYVEKYSREYELDENFVYAVIKAESGFDEEATSSKGAMGLMQIMPDTFVWLMSKTNEEYAVEKLLEPEISIKYGSYFLSILYENFGDWKTVYAAYNAGMNRVKGWLSDPDICEFGKLKNIPIKETRDYVQKVENDVRDYQRLYSYSHFNENAE